MVIIQCSDGKLEVPDWMLEKPLCMALIVRAKNWNASHTKLQVWRELNALAKK